MSCGQIEIMRIYKSDIAEAMDLVWEVFSEFEAPDYAEEGVAEFRQYIGIDAISERMEKGELALWGSFEGGRMTGVIAMRTMNHISLLFVRKEYHCRGIARRLFETAKQGCAGAEGITVNSSPYAVEAYKHLGFVPTDEEKTLNGIRFIPMKYLL